jgi:hypothetical protein
MRSQAFFACTTKKTDDCSGRAAETRGAAQTTATVISQIPWADARASQAALQRTSWVQTALSHSAKAQSFVRQQWQSKHQSRPDGDKYAFSGYPRGLVRSKSECVK